jgi:hypothetical protein
LGPTQKWAVVDESKMSLHELSDDDDCFGLQGVTLMTMLDC